jgi:tRNA threonylcarbamoyladenosine biosynthesis protein TsaB
LKESGLAMRDLNAVAISNGPGSYTSLRVGTSTAKGICYALEIPLIAIDTLESLAHAAFNEIKNKDALYCPMIDARRMEVYIAFFEIRNDDKSSQVKRLTETTPLILDVTSFSEYFSLKKPIVFSGNGAPKFEDIIKPPYAYFVDKLCTAGNLPPLSYEKFLNNDFVDIAYHTPEYLKAPNITTPKKVF